MPTLWHSLPYKILDHLRQEAILTVDQYETITAEKTPREQNGKLYKILETMKKDEAAIKTIKKAICSGLCESVQYCPLSPGLNRPTPEDQHRRREKLQILMKEELDVMPILDVLAQKKFCSQYMLEKIRAQETRRDRVDTLLMFVSRFHRDAHKEFMDIVRENHPWIFR